jgi:hypothetical protein
VNRFAASSFWILLLLLALTAIFSTGCGSLEASDNASARPWNAPASWETGGLPSSMTEGH